MLVGLGGAVRVVASAAVAAAAIGVVSGGVVSSSRAATLSISRAATLSSSRAATASSSGAATASGRRPGAPAVHESADAGFQLSLAWQVGPLDDTGSPIAESSPIVADLPGGPAVVVGDRAGRLYAYYLAGDGDGHAKAVPGWPVGVGTPVDSAPSATILGGDFDTVFVGSGDDLSPANGGYHAYGPTGKWLWNASVQNPRADEYPDGGVSAGLTVTDLQGKEAVMAGSLGQEGYALDAKSGSTLAGWPFFTSDSTHSTAAAADLYGTGQTELVEGGDQTAGFALGQHYSQGGHLRILNANGGLICNADVDQTVDSSPAVGGFLSGGATGEVVGTGSYFPGASATDQLLSFDTDCGEKWATTLDYATSSSPALADVEGNGQLQVVEGTASQNAAKGSVWVLDGATGAPICHAPATAAVIGSVVTADLTGNGTQDLLVPTIDGVDIFDHNCDEVATIATGGNGSYTLGFQSSPLVTQDPNGSIGITLAGYGGPNGGSGYIEHYELAGSDGALVDEPGSWPMFHHDPQLTGDAGGTPGSGSVAACTVPSAAESGYNLVNSAGGVFSFGQPSCGSTGDRTPGTPVVGMAMAPDTAGYWLVTAAGRVFYYGGARFYGSLAGVHLDKPIVGMAATPDGRGYWLVAADGGVFAFGDARFYGSMGGKHLNKPIVGMAASPDGRGYWLVAADGGIFTFGDAAFNGSMGGTHLNKPMVGVAGDVATGGYWEVASDGGIFAFGAPFLGSMGGQPVNPPIVGISPTTDGHGYRLVADDGRVWYYGDAGFHGSMARWHLYKPVVAMAGS